MNEILELFVSMGLIADGTPDILVSDQIPKEMNQMNPKKILVLIACILLAVSSFAQGNRGKAELAAEDGSITIDYGRPALKGRDMLSKLQVGSFWRMGSNQATVFTTPIDLEFGSIKVPKGAYSIWLLLVAADNYELVFNTQTGQWGMQHDVSKDACKVPLKKSPTSSSVEVFTIELKEASGGGTLSLNWGNISLSTGFKFVQ